MALFLYIPSAAVADERFIITVKTDNAGSSNNNQFTIPVQGAYTYDYDVETSDGQSFTTQISNLTITFPSAGTYDIFISGLFPQILFNNGGDRLKLLDIKQWGVNQWEYMNSSFFGCNSLTAVSATDSPDLSLLNTATGLASTFRQALNITSINCNDWDISTVTTVNGMFLDTDFLDIKFDNWQMHQVRNLSLFARDIGMSTANYDATLIAWEADLQSQYPSGVGYPSGTYNPNFRGVTYTGGGAAQTARQSLITNFGWSILDGGSV